MQFRRLIVLVAVLSGCATSIDDSRLQGTWRSNREVTLDEAFRRDPRLTNAPPERIQRFKEMFGHLTLTYSNGISTTLWHGKAESARYRVIKRGSNYVVVRPCDGVESGRDIRLRFVDGDRGYWVQTPLGFEERFDRVGEPNTKQ
jgi:hypothetical protein